MQVALLHCTPAESKNRTTVGEDYRNLTINNAPVLWPIVIFVHSWISNRRCCSVCVFYVILSLSQRLSQWRSSTALMPMSGSAHMNDVDIVKYKRNNVIIIVFWGMISVMSNWPQTWHRSRVIHYMVTPTPDIPKNSWDIFCSKATAVVMLHSPVRDAHIHVTQYDSKRFQNVYRERKVTYLN